MHAQPLVSAIVRTRNRPDRLQACLQSITRQNYRPLQIVVINDGGEDVSEITRRNLPTDVELELVQLTENVGRTAAANRGLEAATGDYLSFLDDDDYWLPHHLSSLVASLPHTDQGVEPAAFPDCAVYAATRAVLAGEDEQEREIKVYSVPFDRDHLLYSNYLPILSVLFSRSVIDAGVRFDESFDLFEDWDFWLQVSRQIPFTSIPDITCVYRLHEQASGVHSAARTASAYQAIYKKWLADYVSADFYALLHKTHAWHTEAIAALQAINQAKMEAIGQQHSHAISVIGLKDINIAALQEAFNHALGVVAEKDEAIKQLTTSYAHAIEVINEKDRASAKAAQEYQHAIAVIQEKDQATAKLLQEYQHAIAVIQEKDQATGKLLQDYHHAIAVIQEKDEATAKLLQEYHHAITVIQEKDQATAKLLQEYHQATELIQEKDQATAQLQRDLKLSVEVVETNQRTIAQLKQEVMALTAQVERLRERINNPIKWHANRLLGRNDDKEE